MFSGTGSLFEYSFAVNTSAVYANNVPQTMVDIKPFFIAWGELGVGVVYGKQNNKHIELTPYGKGHTELGFLLVLSYFCLTPSFLLVGKVFRLCAGIVFRLNRKCFPAEGELFSGWGGW